VKNFKKTFRARGSFFESHTKANVVYTMRRTGYIKQDCVILDDAS